MEATKFALPGVISDSMDCGRVGTQSLPKFPRIVGSWIGSWSKWAHTTLSHSTSQCQVQLDESRLWLEIRCSLLKHLMALACITDSPTSLNLGLRGCQPSNSVFHLASSYSLSHVISQLTSHLSILVYDVKLNAHMSHIYGWWIDLITLHFQGSVRKN